MAHKNPVIVCVDDDEAMRAAVVRWRWREALDVRSTLSASEVTDDPRTSAQVLGLIGLGAGLESA